MPPQPQNEFTNLTDIKAEAIGQPGHRTFRILADAEGRSAVLWVEKQQLLQLAVALRQIVMASESVGAGQPRPQHSHDVGTASSLDFRVGRLMLGEDTSTSALVLDAHDVESEVQGEQSQAVLRMWITRPQAEKFAEQAIEVCAAGRPLCPLCDGPIDPEGHVCPRKNGHFKDVKEL